MEGRRERGKGRRFPLARRIFSAILAAAIFLLGAACGYQARRMVAERGTPEVTTAMISEQIEGAGDLASAKMAYRGLFRYSEGDIPLLTQKAFNMVYTAQVTAGFDLSKAMVTLSDKECRITLPEAGILSVKADPASVEFYDESWALFNWTEKKDITDTLAMAEDDAREHIDEAALKEKARSQAKEVLSRLVAPIVGDNVTVTVE